MSFSYSWRFLSTLLAMALVLSATFAEPDHGRGLSVADYIGMHLKWRAGGVHCGMDKQIYL